MTSSILRAGRILSSDETNSVSQSQNVDVNIKVQSNPKQDSTQTHQSTHQPNVGITPQHSVPLFYPNVPQSSQNVNFTMENPMTDASQFPSVAPNVNVAQSIDLTNEISDLKVRNEFLELLLNAFQANPLRINSYVVVNHTLLIQMIKLLTGSDKVDILIDMDIGCDCSGCCADVNNDEIYYIQKILVTKDGSTTELKYSHNNVYSEFIKLGISLKICSR